MTIFNISYDQRNHLVVHSSHTKEGKNWTFVLREGHSSTCCSSMSEDTQRQRGWWCGEQHCLTIQNRPLENWMQPLQRHNNHSCRWEDKNRPWGVFSRFVLSYNRPTKTKYLWMWLLCTVRSDNGLHLQKTFHVSLIVPLPQNKNFPSV